MQRNHCRHILCVFIAIFFIIGIFGTIKNTDMESFGPYINDMQQGEAAEETGADLSGTDRLIPVSSLQKIDDFQAAAAARRINTKTEETMRAETLLCLAAIIFLFCVIILAERLYHFSGKRITVFAVVVFIHQMDGKKKSCFEQ